MKLAPTPCADKECYALATYRGKCEAHQPKAWVGSTRGARLPPDWQTRRRIVLQRDKAICHLCGKGGADGVDHVIAGDDHSLDNLKPVHDKVPPNCHKFKSSAEGHQAKQDQKQQPSGQPNRGYWRGVNK